MEFRDITKEEFEKLRRPKKAVQSYLEEFEASGKALVEVMWSDSEYSSCASCAGAFSSAARSTHRNHIHVMTRKGRVFLINTLRCE